MKTLLFVCLLTANAVVAQQAATTTPNKEPIATVEIESTISGNAEQPKTIYVLPWQESVARIKMNNDDDEALTSETQPLDREEFLRFIQAADAPVVAPQDQ
ncbi:MAG TPA: hypothetical protein DCS87_15535 [Rheinheimera sp.]|nr:hypothetical protein [Rheinheimera sp.]